MHMHLRYMLEGGEVRQHDLDWPPDHLFRSVHWGLSPELWALATVAAVYSKAFLEALAKKNADALADLVRARFRRTGNNAEAEIGLPDEETATIAITADTPDEARLALLDLDVTADELHGKVLRWDSSASAWRPDDD